MIWLDAAEARLTTIIPLFAKSPPVPTVLESTEDVTATPTRVDAALLFLYLFLHLKLKSRRDATAKKALRGCQAGLLV